MLELFQNLPLPPPGPDPKKNCLLQNQSFVPKRNKVLGLMLLLYDFGTKFFAYNFSVNWRSFQNILNVSPLVSNSYSVIRSSPFNHGFSSLGRNKHFHCPGSQSTFHQLLTLENVSHLGHSAWQGWQRH